MKAPVDTTLADNIGIVAPLQACAGSLRREKEDLEIYWHETYLSLMKTIRKDLVFPVILIHLLIMSGKTTSAKKNMSGEATSPDNHMSAVDRRLNIMSGGGTSSNKAILDESASAKELKSESPLFLDELHVGVTGTIFVMLCRIWDVTVVTGQYLSTDMVVSYARESHYFQYFRLKSEHAIAVGLNVKTFFLQGNAIHCSARKDDAFMLEFNGATSARKSLAKAVGFVRHPFQLVKLNSVELTDNKYMIDVAGYITNVGRSIQQRTGSRTMDFYLANERGQMLRVTLWEGLGDTLIEKKTKDVGHCAINLTAMNVKTYNNKLYLSRSSSTQIFDDPNIPALKEPRSKIRVTDQTLQILQIKPVNFVCSFYLLSADRQYQDAERLALPNVWRGKVYRLELGFSDATAYVVVVMFDETTSELVKCSADSLTQSDEEYLDDTSALPAALANIIGTTHTLELKSHTYYEHGNFESFNCWNLIPPEMVVESAGSSTIDVVPDTPQSSGKRLCKQPSVATPLKPCEGKTLISQELEDSDADSLPVRAWGKKKQRVSSDADSLPVQAEGKKK
ncbi:zinc finger, CCHC-type containing protein [Tanacetum coccineum]|uniref:Zinc finger, CCHC-type containing protein n=1 Tax=Tanacetum coccineum TaxID=301880 RepID=A0ABQ5I6Y6_9ASTR